jgi:hypothetical protein
MVWGFNILGLFRIDGKNTVSGRFKNKRDLICISLEHITCRAGEDPVFIFNYVCVTCNPGAVPEEKNGRHR